MFKVEYNPELCKVDGYLKKLYPKTAIIELGDVYIKHHEECGCMRLLEHYRIKTISKSACPTCGHQIIKREKIMDYNFKVAVEKDGLLRV